MKYVGESNIKYKLSELEEQLDCYLQHCSAHDWLEIIRFSGIVPDNITFEDIDIEVKHEN